MIFKTFIPRTSDGRAEKKSRRDGISQHRDLSLWQSISSLRQSISSLRQSKLIAAVCLPIGLAVAAQAQKPEEHQKTTFTDSVGRLIVQVDMPLYLYISTSPDETPRRLDRNDEKGKEKEPLYLDGPGIHFIRHQDNIHHRAEMYPIWADGQAPKTTLSFSDAPTYNSGTMTYFGKNLTARLSATDDLSGVKQIYYSTGGDNFAPYRNINTDKEGAYRISYYAADNVGNVETVKHKEFTVDLMAPATVHRIAGTVKDGIIAANAQITLTATDELSGVERTVYRFNNEPEKTYRQGTTISVSHLADGQHTLYYYSEDRVRNKETEKSFGFYLDKTPPIMSADVLGDKFIVGDKTYFSGRTKLKLTAVDNKSGVSEIRYSINGEPFVVYEDPFYLPSKTGKHQIRYYSVDEMGNTSSGDYSHNTGVIYVDLSGPTLSHELSGPSFRKGDLMYISPETKITLKGVDTESGLQYLSYIVNGATDEIRYDAPFSVKETGAHTIKYFGYDNVNNRNSREFEITVDAEGPEIFYTFSVKRIDAENADTEVYPSYVMLYLAATDLMTGNAEIYYSVNGGNELPYTAPIKGFAKNTSYVVKVRAKDKLGNFSAKTVEFKTGDY
jgi:hypothetical protein